MSIHVKQQGQYELFETTKKHRILRLDGRHYYAIVEGQHGPVIVKSDSDHQRKKNFS